MPDPGTLPTPADPGRAARLAAALLAALLVALLAVGSASAADVRVVRSTLESDFPRTLTFGLDATASRPIRRATLHYRVDGRRAWVAADARIAAAPGALRAEHRVDLARQYMPPGTRLQFQWLLEDDQGQSSRTELLAATVEDRRFQWRAVRAGPVAIEWYRGDDGFGQSLARIATLALTQLSADTGVALERPVRVLVYADLAEFQSASYQGALEWVGGTFYQRENVILLYAPATQEGLAIAQQALPHELAHAVLHQITDNPFGTVPQWLNEGYATRAEPIERPERSRALAEAVQRGQLISLRGLSGSFPVQSNEAVLAYAESHSAVQFLIERYGRERLRRLLQVYREGVTHDEGMRRALGVDTAEFEQEWRAWLAPWFLIKATPFPTATPAPDASARVGVVDRIRALVQAVRGGG